MEATMRIGGGLLTSASHRFFLTFRDLLNGSRMRDVCKSWRHTGYVHQRACRQGRPIYPLSRSRALPRETTASIQNRALHERHFHTSRLLAARPAKPDPKDGPNNVDSNETSKKDALKRNAAYPAAEYPQQPPPKRKTPGAVDTMLAALDAVYGAQSHHPPPRPQAFTNNAPDIRTYDEQRKQAAAEEEARRQQLFEDADQLMEHLPVPDYAASRYLLKNTRSKLLEVLRRMPQPLAIITSFSHTANAASSGIRHRWSDVKGMTLSSVDSVTMAPVPYISFNSRIPSATFTAISENPNMEFTMHIVRANLRGATVADAFASGTYTPEMITLLCMQAERTIGYARSLIRDSRRTASPDETPEEESDPEEDDEPEEDELETKYPRGDAPLTSYPEALRDAERAVAATLHCRLHGDKCVEVGDHIVAVAEVTHVRKHKRFRGAGIGALYYYNKGFYGHEPHTQAYTPEHDGAVDEEETRNTGSVGKVAAESA